MYSSQAASYANDEATIMCPIVAQDLSLPRSKAATHLLADYVSHSLASQFDDVPLVEEPGPIPKAYLLSCVLALGVCRVLLWYRLGMGACLTQPCLQVHLPVENLLALCG